MGINPIWNTWLNFHISGTIVWFSEIFNAGVDMTLIVGGVYRGNQEQQLL
jgi:hypothetical protein